MKPAKAGQPYSAAINHVIVGQVLHSPALNEGHVLVNPPYLELLWPYSRSPRLEIHDFRFDAGIALERVQSYSPRLSTIAAEVTIFMY